MNQEKLEVFYCLTAMFLMSFIGLLVTFIHESGHAIAGILLGGEVTQFVVTPTGGLCSVHFDYLAEFEYGNINALIMISGGLATALFFTLVGFFKRPFLILVPINIIQGLTEVLVLPELNQTMMHLFSLSVVIICIHFLYVKLWVLPQPTEALQ